MSSLFATPRAGLTPADCYFYHVMEVPGLGLTSGLWDLRANVEDYLGHVPMAGANVLEIGPASGFLTFEMEKRGAQVVAVEVTDEPGWDFVPYPAAVLEPIYQPRRDVMRRLKNSFWFAHNAHRSKAKLLYADVYKLPAELGKFDVAVMASVLLHCQNPLRIVEQCAARAETVVITDMLYPELRGQAVARLAPTRDNNAWDTWWHFSPEFFIQFLQVMGFQSARVTTHVQQAKGGTLTVDLFTVVASRKPSR